MCSLIFYNKFLLKNGINSISKFYETNSKRLNLLSNLESCYIYKTKNSKEGIKNIIWKLNINPFKLFV